MKSSQGFRLPAPSVITDLSVDIRYLEKARFNLVNVI